MIRRLVAFGLAIAGVVALACYPIEAPPGGVASISTLLPPFTAVVVHDTMRDSAGVVRPLRAYAFDTRGDTMKLVATFVVLDSGAHVAGDRLVGDSVRSAPVRVVGSLGPLQTPPLPIYVTVAPTTLALTDTVDAQGHTDTLRFVPDTTWTANTFTLTHKVTGGVTGDTAVPGWIAWYHVELAPASRDTAPTVYIVDDLTKPATSDTGDASGLLSRRIILRAGALADTALVLGHKVDSIVVTVRASYKGLPLSGSPGRVVIPVKFKGFSTP